MTVTEADFVVSATEVAVTVTVTWLAGAALGAVYKVGVPLGVVVGETLPQGAVGQDTFHVTPSSEESFVTWAVMLTVPPACSMPPPVSGDMDTEIGGGGVDEPPLQLTPTATDDTPRSAKARPVLWLTGTSLPAEISLQ